MAKIGCNRRCYRTVWKITSARRTRSGWSRSSLMNWIGRVWVFRDDAVGDRPAGLSSLYSAEDLPLRLSQPRTVEPAARTEAQRNTELMWLTGRLAPDFKTIADFRKDNGAAIRAVCSQFVVLCRQRGLF